MIRDHLQAIDKFLVLIGMAGVHRGETDDAFYWEGIFAWPMLCMAVWLPFQWYLSSHGAISASLANNLSWIIWMAFLIETIVLTYFVQFRGRYLRQNWMNLLIIASAFPVLWGHAPMTGMIRSLRILIIPRLIIAWWRR